MKRKRVARRPAPSGLAQIRVLELIHWAAYGPVVGDGPGEWPSWQEWADVYARCREAWLAQLAERRAAQLGIDKLAEQMIDEPVQVPAAERIYQAMLRGEDPDELQREIGRELFENDPREHLGEEVWSHPVRCMPAGEED